ncbi:MAG: glutamate-1-semialdehyde 2,1-aminomutase [Candidatus Manganitrophaceae bacterium]
MKRTKSAALFQEAEKRIPGGVNSPVRAFKAVGGNPLFIKKAKGSKIVDVDGNRFIDYVLSWGPMIVGHAHPKVIEAIQKTAANGTSFGAPSPLEIELAKSIQANFPLMERLRLVNSGTEATMSAIRLARAYTQRNKIIKFEGCYHGHADSLLVKAGSGATTLGVPDSPGVPPDLARDTITLPFNNLKALQKTLEQEGNQIACLIVEPVPGNMGTVLPDDGFLPGLRELTRPFGIVLIFDEVITGFRAAPGGAQERYGIRPDLTCLGKIIGGGLPVGAYGGRKEIMEMISPVGPVYQAGTLSGNPIAMAAGIATLSLLRDPAVYEKLEKRAADLAEGLADAARKAKIPVQINRIASQITLFFNSNRVVDYTTALQSDRNRFSKFFLSLLSNGVYFPPSQFEAFFVSTAHSPADIEKTVEAAHRAFKKI